jgi:Domain of unknown function (DUF4266)
MNRLRIIFLLALAGSTVACSTVKPWQRSHLADYTMRPDRDPLTGSIAEHVWFTREAFAGGSGVGGGGCGCN